MFTNLKKYLAVLLIAATFSVSVNSAKAAVFPSGRSLLAGGEFFPSLDSGSGTLVRLVCFATNAACTVRDFKNTSRPVTSAKIWYVTSVITTCTAGGATGGVWMAQSDNDIGNDSATALTNPVYYGGVTTFRGVQFPNSTSTTNPILVNNVYFEVAAGKFLTFGGLAAGYTCQYQAIGYER